MQSFGIIAALISAASWALGSILFSKIGKKMSPFGMTLSKGMLGIILLGLAYLSYGIDQIPLNAAVMLFISGIIGIAIGDTLFFASLQDLGPRLQIIFFMLGQVITAILSLLILREMPALLQWMGIAVTLAGVVIVLWNKVFQGSERSKSGTRGIVLGLLAMLCFSFSLIIAKQGMMTISSIGAVFIRMTAGTIGILIYGLFKRQIFDWLTPFRDVKMVLLFFVSVCIVTFGGFWLSLVAIKFLHVTVACALGATEPFFILPMTYFFLKERITWIEIIGSILTVGGIVIIIIASI